MPEFTPAGYLLIGLTGIVGFLAGVMGFALLRLLGTARKSGRHLRESNVETALLSAALQEAVTKLKTQERSSLARAEASERLNAQIVDGLTSGLLVAGGDGQVRMLNPAGHRILGIAPRPMPAPIDELLRDVPALAAVVREAITSGRPAVSRRHVATGTIGGPSHLGLTLSPWAGSQPGETGVICLFTDLSRVVTLEEQLRLKEALARLGELTAGLAHEFRNGLATIHGYARLLDPEALPAAPVHLRHRAARRDPGARRAGDQLPQLRPSRAAVAAAARSRGRGAARRRRRRCRRRTCDRLWPVRRGRW